jgi:(E)-4-hydroxy-3-methylbut-2-enyl-diphosphate synthase
VRGKVIATVPESKIVETLIEEAMKLAEAELDAAELGERGTEPGQPIVTVS